MKEFAALKPYISRYKVHYLLGLFFLVIVDASQMFIPQLTRDAINIISTGDFLLKSVFKLCIMMVLLMLVIALGRFAWRRMIHGSSRKVEALLRQKLFEKLLTLNSDYYEKNKIGDLMARSINDIAAVRMAIGWGFVAGIDGSVMAITILIIIFVQDPATAALAIIPFPLISLLIIFFGKIVAKYFKKVQEKYSRLSEIVQETFAGISVVKSFVKESYFIKKFADTNEDYKKANMDVVKVHGSFFPFITFLAGLVTLIVLLAGGRAVILGKMGAGDLVALLSYMQMLIWPMLGTGFTVTMMQRGAVSMKRINEVLTAEPAIKELGTGDWGLGTGDWGLGTGEIYEKAAEQSKIVADNSNNLSDSGGGSLPLARPLAPAGRCEASGRATPSTGRCPVTPRWGLDAPKPPAGAAAPETPLPSPKGASAPLKSPVPIIEFKNLSFSYRTDKGENQVLKNINLILKEGEWLGIFGRTGAGKSTLIKLLPRLIDPPEGTVFVAGADVRHWKLRSLRSLFAVSPQESQLFSDTIANNIFYGVGTGDWELGTGEFHSDSPQPKQASANNSDNAADCGSQHIPAKTPSPKSQVPSPKPGLELGPIIHTVAFERDLAGFKDGVETIVGEKGVMLSGGQKQRIAIARALVTDSRILILDDSLSALDVETEQKLLDGIFEKRRDKTTIIISHRICAFRNTNKVAVLENGEITACAPHKELLQQNDYYSKTAKLQIFR